MQFDKWIDLSEYGMDLKLVRVPRGAHYFMVRDVSKNPEPGKGVEISREGLSTLGFRQMRSPTGGTLPMFIREARSAPDGRALYTPEATDWTHRFPKAKVVDFTPARDFIDQMHPAHSTPAEEEASGPRP